MCGYFQSVRSTEDLQPIVESIAGLRARSRFNKIIMLKDYVKWCIEIENVPDACDGMLNLKPLGIDQIRHRSVASPLHLQKYLDMCFAAESIKSIDNIYRCYYWLAYAGVRDSDIIQIKCTDVDLRNMVVNYNGTEYPIYRESIEAFRNCVELKKFAYNHPNYTSVVFAPRVDSDLLLRGIRSNPTVNAIREELSRRSNKYETQTGIRLSYFRAWLSGIFYRAYEDELAGGEPNFEYVVADKMKGKTYKLASGGNKIDAKKRKMIRDFQEDYQRWKLAFKI